MELNKVKLLLSIFGIPVRIKPESISKLKLTKITKSTSSGFNEREFNLEGYYNRFKLIKVSTYQFIETSNTVVLRFQADKSECERGTVQGYVKCSLSDFEFTISDSILSEISELKNTLLTSYSYTATYNRIPSGTFKLESLISCESSSNTLIVLANSYKVSIGLGLDIRFHDLRSVLDNKFMSIEYPNSKSYLILAESEGKLFDTLKTISSLN